MSPRGSPVVYAFFRKPVLGAVKSRLAARIGPVAALQFYRQTSLALLRRIENDRRWRIVIALTPDAAVRTPGAWPPGVPRLAQGSGDLGQRMARVFASDLRVPALLVGGDIPDISASHIARAFAALRAADIVFGPATDGGFWLVGRRPRLAMDTFFERVRWSSSHALADTMTNIPARYSVALVDTLDDVDDAEAYARLARRG